MTARVAARCASSADPREQLNAGWATSYVFDGRPVARYSRLLASERAGRSARRGVWARCGGRFHRAL